MYYYSFNIGDYTKDTTHLSELEDLAYRRMMDLYYSRELPLPKEQNEIGRLIRMRTHCECIAIVLQDFFTLEDDGYHQLRIDSEINAYHEKSDKARKSAKARWKKVKQDQKVKQPCERNANAYQTQCEGNAKQEPINNKQEPLNSKDMCASIDAEISDLFEAFWLSGIKKVNKKKAKVIFTKIIKSETNMPAFNSCLIFDVKNRLKLNQMGFAEMHPTTYLNGERWKDDYPENKQHYQQLSTTERTTQANRESYERTQREIAELEAQINDDEIVGSVQQGTWSELQ